MNKIVMWAGGTLVILAIANGALVGWYLTNDEISSAIISAFVAGFATALCFVLAFEEWKWLRRWKREVR